MKVFIVTTIPSPYRIPLFNKINIALTKKGIQLTVVFLSGGYERRKWAINKSEWSFEHVTLTDPSLTKGEGFTSLAWSLPSLLIKHQPDVVVVGGFSLASLWASLYSFLFNRKMLVWSGETADEANRRSLSAVRRIFRQFIVKLTDGYIAYGKAASNYLVNLGVDQSLITISTNTVDTQFFSSAADSRTKKNSNQPIRFAFIGHLERRKGIMELLSACQSIHQQISTRFEVHIIGSGLLETTVTNFIADHKLTNVYMHGFQQKEYIRDFFKNNDVVVFPSLHELYGLVPIEAMAGGNAVLISKYTGIAHELITCEERELLIDPYDSEAMRQILQRLVCEPCLIDRFKNISLNTALPRFNINYSAEAFSHGITSAINRI